MERWFLTSHQWAAITHSLKEMCALDNYEWVGTHKEAAAARMKRDQEDIDRLVSSFNSGLLTNQIRLDKPNLSLLNIATGVVLPEHISDRLLDATEMGKRSRPMEKGVGQP